MDECFYYFNYQVIHNDATVCPPLVYEAKQPQARRCNADSDSYGRVSVLRGEM